MKKRKIPLFAYPVLGLACGLLRLVGVPFWLGFSLLIITLCTFIYIDRDF